MKIREITAAISLQIVRFGKVFHFAKQYYPVLLSRTGLIMMQQFILAISPILVRYIIDEVIPASDIASLHILFGTVISLYIILAGTKIPDIFMIWYLQENIGFNIRHKLYTRLLNHSAHFYTGKVTGEITSRLNNDVDSVTFLCSDAFFEIFSSFLQIAVSLSFLFYLNWKITLLVLSIAAVQYILITINMHFQRKYQKRISTGWGRMLGYFQEVVSGMKLIQAFGTENREAANHIKKSRPFLIDSIRMGIINRCFSVIGLFFGYLFPLAVIVYSAGMLSTGEITIGLIFASLLYITNFFEPLFNLSGTFVYMIGAMVSVDRIFEYLDAPLKIDNPANPIKVPAENGVIEFKNVAFKYEVDSKTVLENVSLTIQPGQAVAFVGYSGSGKSTMINLLLRMFDPESGEVLYHGNNIKNYEIDDYRDNMSLVFQMPMLFNDTILNNLRYAREDATEEEVMQACRDANIEDFIKQIPDGLQTMIGERGLKLSGGQKQRLAIARAILKNPKILILDEATASVDSISENKIQDALEKIMIGRTTIVIAHRLTTIRNVDKIYVFNTGGIVESGSHDQLLANEGLYHQLWTTQIKEEIKTETDV